MSKWSREMEDELVRLLAEARAFLGYGLELSEAVIIDDGYEPCIARLMARSPALLAAMLEEIRSLSQDGRYKSEAARAKERALEAEHDRDLYVKSFRQAQERADGAQAKVSALESQVAGLRGTLHKAADEFMRMRLAFDKDSDRYARCVDAALATPKEPSR